MKISTAVPFIGGQFLMDYIPDDHLGFQSNSSFTKTTSAMSSSKAYSDLLQHPFMNALFGRRARRFGLGMEIPSGPMAYRSDKEPIPLSETEQMLLLAAGTGVSGWHFGIPYGPQTPDSHAEFCLRLTGRTGPTAAGLGIPAMFYTDDKGCYCTRTRDVEPQAMQELKGEENDLDRIISVCRENTIRIKEGRLDLPSSPPHILPPNLWWANKPGSTIFMPVADAAEECLGILALMIRHGVMVVDHETGKPAGNLQSFINSGLLDVEKKFPLSELQTIVSEGVSMALACKGHNMVLMLQAMGLGGLFFAGIDDMSVMGAHASKGTEGLGFRFTENDNWVTPNPLGLEGVYEAHCPPFYKDMHAAVVSFTEKKFGSKGTYTSKAQGPWRESMDIKKSVESYSEEFIDCMTEIAQYIYDKYGKFPGIRSTVMMPCFVQAHHLDTDFYDKYYKDGAYLQTHADHMAKWHGE